MPKKLFIFYTFIEPKTPKNDSDNKAKINFCIFLGTVRFRLGFFFIFYNNHERGLFTFFHII